MEKNISSNKIKKNKLFFRKTKKMKNKERLNKYNIILFLVALIVTMACATTGNYINDGYFLDVNSISPVRFKAPHEIENTFVMEQKRAEAAVSVKEIYKFIEGVNEQVNSQLDTFFSQVDSLRIAKLSAATYIPNSSLPIPTDIESEIAKTNFTSYLTNSQIYLLLDMDYSIYSDFRVIVKEAMNAVMEQGIIAGDEEKSLYTLREELENRGLTQDMRTLGQEIGKFYMLPNQEVDNIATEKAISDKINEVEAVIIRKDQTIISEGEIITEEIFLMLQASGFINTGYSGHMPAIIGINLFIIISFVLFCAFLKTFYKETLSNKKEVSLLFTLYLLIIVSVRLLMNIPYLFLPIIIFTLLVSILLDPKLGIFTNTLITIISMFITKNPLTFVIYYIVSGTTAAIIGKKLTERNKVITLGTILSLTNGILAGSLYLLFEQFSLETMVIQIISGVASGFLYTIICMGSLPFWEAVYGIVTTIKLLDLTNPSNELLRRLTIEAPGTYHHSLIVANLAEVAAYDIGANSALARVGGYYHDIGKLKYPQYFTENQGGLNPHDYMDPYNSVQVIVSHATYGLELANEYKLPKLVKDIIVQHHGNSLIRYFYVKATTEYPDREINEDDFRYNNNRPQFKESAIVMLADTVEAAVRSMITSSTSEEVESFVKKLIKDKLDQGQLADSGFVIKDLDTISDSFIKVFKGMYHERIAYPSMPNVEKKEEAKEKPKNETKEETTKDSKEETKKETKKETKDATKEKTKEVGK